MWSCRSANTRYHEVVGTILRTQTIHTFRKCESMKFSNLYAQSFFPHSYSNCGHTLFVRLPKGTFIAFIFSKWLTIAHAFVHRGRFRSSEPQQAINTTSTHYNYITWHEMKVKYIFFSRNKGKLRFEVWMILSHCARRGSLQWNCVFVLCFERHNSLDSQHYTDNLQRPNDSRGKKTHFLFTDSRNEVFYKWQRLTDPFYWFGI